MKKQIKFTQTVIRTESVEEVRIIDLEWSKRWLDFPEGVTIDDVMSWADSDEQEDQEKLNDFIWDNSMMGDVEYEEYVDCHDVQVEDIFDISKVD